MWAVAPEPREQSVLFPERLDQAIPPDHSVRQFDLLLKQLDWTEWENLYDLRRGQPPIHPRILASVLLWGLLNRIRASRVLEEAVSVRLDFRWLVEGRSLDHTTISEFRRRHGALLKKLFIQVVTMAQTLGYLTLAKLGFDGTRVRASNRRSGTRSIESIRQEHAELTAKFDQAEQQAREVDQHDEEIFAGQPTHAASQQTPADSEESRKRLAELDVLLQVIEAEEAAGGTLPNRLPITDPDARVMPNKDGGFGVNYTPIALVDIDTGLIVEQTVSSAINEDHLLVLMVQDAQETFDVPEAINILTDSLNGTNANAAGCEAIGATLYSPTGETVHPLVLRADLTQPIAEEKRDQLPTQKQGRIPLQIVKSTFVYDESSDHYFCPMGKPLKYHNTTTESRGKGRAPRERRRYVSKQSDCANCPLRAKCVVGKSGTRTVSRDQHESSREAMSDRMATEAGKKLYKQRSHPVERVFAVIKHQFGLRQMLLRGLEKVQVEWCWASVAFNLQRVLSLKRSHAQPPPGTPVTA